MQAHITKYTFQIPRCTDLLKPSELSSEIPELVETGVDSIM